MIRANDLEFLKLKLNINTEDNIEKITRLTGRETILLIYKIISAELRANTIKVFLLVKKF